MSSHSEVILSDIRYERSEAPHVLDPHPAESKQDAIDNGRGLELALNPLNNGHGLCLVVSPTDYMRVFPSDEALVERALENLVALEKIKLQKDKLAVALEQAAAERAKSEAAFEQAAVERHRIDSEVEKQRIASQLALERITLEKVKAIQRITSELAALCERIPASLVFLYCCRRSFEHKLKGYIILDFADFLSMNH
ncbi:hypothetical protein CVT26_012953 [Gymnopilus dilepis]|uniref:Uncharacterized protein n=1 Tax=Gymnopilus dilepis TaxID=231916 RepID=A0A409WVJ8_9AGAR|nr:hypothetical protein CVT26_012953 [Gymnopilus dilepis]